jgi:hypothetical protein
MSFRHKSNCSDVSGGLEEEDCKYLDLRRLNFVLVTSTMDESGKETAMALFRRRRVPHAG